MDIEELATNFGLPSARLLPSVDQNLTKFGGVPLVSAGFVWPQFNRRPMAFLCQIDLSALARLSLHDWLPKCGLLSFFYDCEREAWGYHPDDRGAWAVLYHADAGSLKPATQPDDLPEDSRYEDHHLSLNGEKSLPSLERLAHATGGMDEILKFVGYSEEKSTPAHRIGGYPMPLQNDDMEYICERCGVGMTAEDTEQLSPEDHDLFLGEIDEWRLLLQLDTDPAAEMMWCDEGRLYFWIRERDALAQDYSKVWMILQSR